MAQTAPIETLIDKPLFDPTYLNVEYFFQKILDFINPIISFFTNPHTWTVAGIISSCLTIFFLGIIIFCLVRMWEMQQHEKHEIAHEIHEALLRKQERDRNTNPRWHYILTLVESPNESDWRVAIIESDTMMEEILKDKGLVGNTVSELLEEAKSNGYLSMQNAWDAHLVRNKIAHEGSEFPLSQIEARRAIKQFENFFEELRVI